MADLKIKKYGFKGCLSCLAVFAASSMCVQYLKCLGERHSHSCAIWAQAHIEGRLQALLLQETLLDKLLGSDTSEGPENKDGTHELSQHNSLF